MVSQAAKTDDGHVLDSPATITPMAWPAYPTGPELITCTRTQAHGEVKQLALYIFYASRFIYQKLHKYVYGFLHNRSQGRISQRCTNPIASTIMPCVYMWDVFITNVCVHFGVAFLIIILQGQLPVRPTRCNIELSRDFFICAMGVFSSFIAKISWET